MLGVLLLLYRNTNLITAHRYRAVIVQDTGSPEMQIVISMLCLYGLMWIADCLIRPNRGTIVAAAAFNLLNWFVLFQPFVVSDVRY